MRIIKKTNLSFYINVETSEYLRDCNIFQGRGTKKGERFIYIKDVRQDHRREALLYEV